MARRTRSGHLLGGERDRTRLATGTALVAAAAVVLVAMVGIALAQRDAPARAPTAQATTPPPSVQALSAVVMDRASGVILYAKAPHRRLPTASLTKIMTALVVLERTRDLEQSVAVPPTAIGQHGAGIGLRPGDVITYRQLLLGLIVKSATDCAITLATAVAGDEASFAGLMNARAAELGLRDTHFVNCTGLNVPGHYSSARDLSELGRVAMRDLRFRRLARRVWARITWAPSRETFVVSRNRLNARYDWVDGIKTGATEGTGACMVASGRYGGRRLIVTTLHEPNRDQEVRDALELFRYGASRFARSVVVRRGDRVGEVDLATGGVAALVAERDLSRVVRKGARVKTRIQAPSTLAGPTDDVVGYARFSADGMLLGIVPLRAAQP
jgi:serine-type D-Ala-D-Ala carboxypeptidase (penicillin-binding protein 5/6)